jgi:predicted TIM-barrel fold metal-dependent hydrolase
MAEEKRKGGGAKNARSEIVTVRLDPRLRYLAEVAAKVQRRTLSSYIESAVETSLSDVVIDPEKGISVAAASSTLWFIGEPARLARLNQLYPHLLNIKEQRLVRAAKEMRPFIGSTTGRAGDERDQAERHAEDLRPYWEFLEQAAEEDLPIQEIATGVREIKRRLNDGNPVTAERIDEKIEELTAKHKIDIEWLQAEKAKLLAAAKS